MTFDLKNTGIPWNVSSGTGRRVVEFEYVEYVEKTRFCGKIVSRNIVAVDSSNVQHFELHRIFIYFFRLINRTAMKHK